MCLVGVPPALAQTGQITGVISDSTTGEALPGVNVVIVGTQQGTSTGAEGNYTIPDIEAGTYSLRATFVGYTEKIVQDVSVSAGEATQVDVALAPSAVQLDEVVAIGYGTQREEELTSSISRVTEENFVQSAPRDVGAMIEDQVAGLNITQASGNPTSGSQISLRGVSTIQSSSAPLILIDGVPGDLDTVSPEQVKSIDVIKSGAAASIYGTRGSNGVILIQTKRHEEGEPLRLDYSGTVGTQQLINQPDFFSASEIRDLKEEGRLPNVQDFGHSTDWQDQVLRDNPVTQTQFLAVSGGDQNTNYRASIKYEDREGMILRSDNKESNTRLRVDHTMWDGDLQVAARGNIRTQNFFTGDRGGGSFNQDVWNQALIRNPTDQIKNDQGGWQERNRMNYRNPVGLLEESNGTTEVRELRIVGDITYSPIDNLSLNLLASNTDNTFDVDFDETQQHVSTTKRGAGGFAQTINSSDEEQLLEFTTRYDDRIGDHNFDLLAGYTWNEHEFETSSSTNDDFPADGLGADAIQFGDALTDGEATLNSNKTSWTLIGTFGRVNYTYDNKYILSGSVRYEGNSKFGENEKWGTFPAVSGGWRISEEEFMDDLGFVSDIVSNLKFRAGWGVTGNAPDQSFLSLASFTFSGRFFNDGEFVQGIEPARNPNPNLKWERKTELNFGVDFGFINDRISGSVDVYRRETDDLLFEFDVPSPPNLFGSQVANVGTIENNGVESTVTFDVFRGRSSDDINYSTTFNFSTNTNELKSLSNERFPDTRQEFFTGGIGGPIQRASHRLTVGGPVGQFFGFDAVDITEDGEWIIQNSDGETLPISEAQEGDRTVIGNGTPDWRLSWNHSVQYKNFDLSLGMGGEFGHQILNFTRMFFENPNNDVPNFLDGAFDPIFGKSVLGVRENFVDFYLENGDYWKIENLTVGYTFDSLLEGSIGNRISSARIYFTGRNLATITGYDGVDPEVNTSGLAPGNDPRFKFPTTRELIIGLDLTF